MSGRALLTEVEVRVAELALAAPGIEAVAEALGVRPEDATVVLETVYRKLGPAGSATH
ncbi:hypothetical protein QRX60_03925 [Amycolatopsis mongoliensis]|uniref:Uncharacterized protein n=1 Tax=Amycolatopsis mongoliensis TaxID=715475 RepID=A0A9Y2NIK4_9PSEU|nr:hypothetical protein [Amycolatopsis sp. 4-36]WIY03029.1 hypothetical protein QRX60_03925 [Amycolatopsis sp. 4-36]